MNTYPFLSVCCPTYKRPELLAEFYACFLNQDYPVDRRELIILDDAGQFVPFHDEKNGVRLVSLTEKFETIGEKRNAFFEYLSPQSEIYVVADDDDLYFPHWLSTLAKYMKNADVLGPALNIEWCSGYDPIYHHYGYQFNHAAHAVRLSTLREAGGYPAMHRYEDEHMFGRLRQRQAIFAWTPCHVSPYFVARRGTWYGKRETTHWSQNQERELRELEQETNLQLKPADVSPYFSKMAETFDCRFLCDAFFLATGEAGYDKIRVNENTPWMLTETGKYVIFAHAPSWLKLHVLKPVTIHGALNGSASAHNLPCKFVINGEVLGKTYRPGDATYSMKLSPGEYRLTVETNAPRSRHSLWVIND